MEKVRKTYEQQPLKDVELIHKLVDSARHPQIKLAYILYFYTGGRTSEVLELTWGDILDQKRIKLKTPKQGKRGGVKQRIIPIPDEISEYIRKFYRGQGLGCPIVHKVHDITQKISVDQMRIHMAKDFKRAGIEVNSVIGPRILRKSMARFMYDKLVESGNNKAIFVVQKVLGHKDASTTVRYIGLDHEEVLGAYDLIHDVWNNNK